MTKPKRNRKRRKKTDVDAAPPTPRSGEFLTDAVVDVEGSPLEVPEGSDVDVDAMVTAIVAAEPDGPTLEPDDDQVEGNDDEGSGPVLATIDVPKFFEAAEDFANGLDRVLADARAVGAPCIQLERLIALVIGGDAEALREAYSFQVYPDEDEPARGKLRQLQLGDDPRVVLVLALEPGVLFLKAQASALSALLRGLRPGAGIGALVQALWNEQQAIELGRRLDSGDPGQE